MMADTMAHFFLDSPTGAVNTGTPVNFVNVAPGSVVQVGVWGARVGNQVLLPSTNNGTIAVVDDTGDTAPDGTIRHIKVRGIADGNVMLEARLGAGGAVWAFTQVKVGKA